MKSFILSLGCVAALSLASARAADANLPNMPAAKPNMPYVSKPNMPCVSKPNMPYVSKPVNKPVIVRNNKPVIKTTRLLNGNSKTIGRANTNVPANVNKNRRNAIPNVP